MLNIADLDELGAEPYVEYYGLLEPPFQIIGTSTRFAYLTAAHQEVLRSCLRVIRDRQGIACVSGPVGIGKSTISMLIRERALSNGYYRVGYVSDSDSTPSRMMMNILMALGELPQSGKTGTLQDQFKTYVKRETLLGYHTIVLLVDEAQMAKPETLKLLKLVSDIGAGESKPVQIILFGQQELPRRIVRDEALSSRVVSWHQLRSLSQTESVEVVKHRLSTAGAPRTIFTEAALETLAKLSGGIPREICKIGYNSLVVGMEREERMIGPTLVEEAYQRSSLRLENTKSDL
jgi:general secretion pathway protein A